MAREASLDAIGILEGTNKSSLLVDFLRHYERIFSEFSNEAINIIEIGVDDGASVRTWARFFPRATIVGIDILESARQHADERIKIEIGDQADLSLLIRICTQYPPTIAIDDGSHKSRDVLFTFQTMFPFVRPGGFYAIEDLFFHYGEQAKGAHNSPILPSDYIFGLGHCLLANHMGQDEYHGLKRSLFDTIDRIEIVRNGIVLAKKKETDPIPAEWWPLVRESNHAMNWGLLAVKLLQADAPLDHTAEVLRKCIELQPENVHHHYYLADVLGRMGDLQTAIHAARRSVELATNEEQRSVTQTRLDLLTAKARRWRR